MILLSEENANTSLQYLALSNSIRELNAQLSISIKESMSFSISSILSNALNEFSMSMKKIIASYPITISESMQNLASSINSNLIKSMKESLNSYEFDYSDLQSSIDFVNSNISAVADSHNYNEEIEYINSYDSKNPETKTTKINYSELFMLICTLISLIYTIMGYYKPDSYNEDGNDALNSINTKLEQIIELESSK